MGYERFHLEPGWAWYRIAYDLYRGRRCETKRVSVRAQSPEAAVELVRQSYSHYGARNFRCLNSTNNTGTP